VRQLHPGSASSRVFLLSPAYCGGRRATFLLKRDATLPLAVRLRKGTLTLGEAFSFMSGLYFRGKLTYASQFAAEAERLPGHHANTRAAATQLSRLCRAH